MKKRHIKNLFLIKTAFNLKELPKAQGKEFVFVGRSNVGKSSLINAIIGVKNLAFVSSTPGKTISINFYKYPKNHDIIIVDLPGYGFAKRSKKTLKYWGTFVEHYLVERHNIKTVFSLVDIRRSIEKEEEDLYKFFLKYQIDFKLVFTKIDKVSKNFLNKKLIDYKFWISSFSRGNEFLVNCLQDPFLTSSLKKIGIIELKKYIENF